MRKRTDAETIAYYASRPAPLRTRWHQHPKVRNLKICIECRGDKPQGLLVCWSCHDKLKKPGSPKYDRPIEACFDLIQSGKVRVIEDGEHRGRMVAKEN